MQTRTRDAVDTREDSQLTITDDEEMYRRGTSIVAEPHDDPPILRYLLHDCLLSNKKAADKIEAVFDTACSKSMIYRARNRHDIRDPITDGPFADVFEGTKEDVSGTEPGQPPTFLLERSEDTPIHPFDTDHYCLSNTEQEGGPHERNDSTPLTSHSTPAPESDSPPATSDSTNPISDSGTGVLKPPIGCNPSDYRLDPEHRDEMVVAPPDAVDSDDYPELYKACGCGQCEERHYRDVETDDDPEDYTGAFADVLGDDQNDGSDGDTDEEGDTDSEGWTCDCTNPIPVTVAGARRIYRHAVGSLWSEDADGNAVGRAMGKYRRFMRADSAILRSEDGEDRGTYTRGVNEDEDTALVSCRLSPTDSQGRLVTPYELLQDCKTAWREARDKLPDDCHSAETVAYYWTLAGTDDWATPHVHCYVWLLDPDDTVTEADFAPVVREFYRASTFASWDAHFEADPPGDGAFADVIEDDDVEDAALTDGAVRVEHEPLLADPDRLAARALDRDDLPERLSDGPDSQSRGAIYVATQFPHLALRGRETDAAAEFAAFCHVANDGRKLSYGSDSFYAFGDVLGALND